MFSCSNVKNLRMSRGWSQEHLAEVSGLNVRTIQRLERGDKGSFETINALCSVFFVKAEELTCDVPTGTDSEYEAVNEKLGNVREQVLEEVQLFRRCLGFLLVFIVAITVHLFIFPEENLWFVWPFLIWGGGLVSRFAWIFALRRKVKEWEAKRIKKLLD